MSELKTQKHDGSVAAFLNSVENERKRSDSFTLLELMQEVTGAEAAMWGSSIVGFGSYHYTYASGREGDWFVAGFAPRKQNLTLYIMAGFDGYETLLARLGKVFVEFNVELQAAKIQTLGERVEDIFFITDDRQQAITDPALCEAIQHAIRRELDGQGTA